MSSMMDGLKRMVGVRNADVPALGRLCWYTVPEDIWVSREDLERKFRDCGLKPEWMPGPIRPSDAFRRASALLQRKNIEIVKDELYANLLVREVASGREEVERHLIWETVDSTQKRLSYRQVATLRLDKAGNTVTATTELGASQEVVYGCDGFSERYDHCLSHYDGNGLRKCVGQIVYALMATVWMCTTPTRTTTRTSPCPARTTLIPARTSNSTSAMLSTTSGTSG